MKLLVLNLNFPTNFFSRLLSSVLVVLSLTLSHSLFAIDKQQTEQELLKLKKAISSVQQKLKKNQRAQSKAEKKLKNADQELAKAVKELLDTAVSIQAQNSSLKTLKLEQQSKQKLTIKQRKLLAAQLKSAYMSGNQEYVKLLLNQEDPAKLSRLLKYYDYLNQARIKDITNLKRTLQRLTAIESEIQNKLTNLSRLQKAQKAQRLAKEEKKKQQKTALQSLQSEYAQNNQRLQQLKDSEKELQELITNIESQLKAFTPPQSLQGLGKFKKKLGWPVKGKLLHRFGSAKFENKLKWNGIVITSQEGSYVNAISQGQVVFSDWLRGFGLLTIVDHGKGYLSLYGQNQSLLKTVGDFVEAGEPLATVGQSGGFNQPALYFEIRYKEKPKNPLTWIKK